MSVYLAIPLQSYPTENIHYDYYSERDFHRCLVQFFRPFVSVRPVDWKCIPESMVYFAPFFEFKELVELYFDYVYQLFEDFRITGRTTIQSTLTKYIRFKLQNYGFPVSSPFPYRADVQPVYGVPSYEYYYGYHHNADLLSRPFMHRDPKALKRILRYVAPDSIMIMDLDDYIDHVVNNIWGDPLMHHVYDLGWNEEQWYVVSERRLKLIVMTVDFVMQMRIENCEDSIMGLKLLFQSIPDPQIAWTEIFWFLSRYLTCSPSEGQLPFIESFRESCQVSFPECLQELLPRSLKHLVRCAVRRRLSLTQSLPHGVCSLGLPRELEDYVLLQTRRDQYRPDIPRLSGERVFRVFSHARVDWSPQAFVSIIPVPVSEVVLCGYYDPGFHS